MERTRALHTMAVEMTTGMLVLAAIAVSVLAWAVLIDRGRRPRLIDVGDMVALWGAAIGTPMIALAIVSGFRQWPFEAFMTSVIARNKILTAVVALGFWIAFLALRAAAGKTLWQRPGLVLYALALTLGGAAFLVFTASIGGALAHKPSGFEEIARMVVETRRTFALPVVASWIGIAAGVLIAAFAVLARVRAAAGRQAVVTRPKTA